MRPTAARALVLVSLSLCAGALGLPAQEPGDTEDAPEPAIEKAQPHGDRTRGPWWTLWSRRAPHDRVIAGMSTIHVYKPGEGFANNEAFGIIYRGFAAATFITTHGPRGYVLAAERSWSEGRWGPLTTMVGFRAGLVYGYDHRLFELAGRTPVLPYGQPVLLVRGGPVTLDLTYTWVVMSVTLGIGM